MGQQSTVTVSKYSENCLSEKRAAVVFCEEAFCEQGGICFLIDIAHPLETLHSTIHTSPWYVISSKQKACQHAEKDQRIATTHDRSWSFYPVA